MQRNVNRSRTFLLSLVAAGGLAPISGALAQDANDMTTPTGWIWQLGISGATVAGLEAQGFRVTDVERVGDGVYNAVSVVNSGAYARTGSHVYVNVTPASLSASLTANNQRLTDLEVFDVGGGQVHMTATAVRNTGGDAAGWGWLHGVTAAQINNWVADANPPIRIIDLDSYIVNGTRVYSAVSVNNTGANQQGWWYYYNTSAEFIAQQLQTNHARLVDIEVHDDGDFFNAPTYTCVMTANTSTNWWWYHGVSAAQISDLMDLKGARVTDLEAYTDPFGQTKYVVVMIDNSNQLSRDVRQVFIDGLSPSAQGGGCMKEVGGSVLASIGAEHVFEPASMLKILYATYAIDRCAASTDSVNNPVFILDRCNNNECPDATGCDSGNELLSAAIREMMEQSDNNRTKAIHDRYGRGVLNAYAQAIGAASTQVNHDIGCGLPANHFTLRDSNTIYEKIADGSLFNQSWQDTLYDLMYDMQGNQGTFNTVINEEAVGLGLTPQELAAFKAACYLAFKGGGYGIAGVTHSTTGGWVTIPFKSGGVIQNREYVVSTFVNNEPIAANAGAQGTAWWLMVRDRIRAALESWDAACSVPNITLNPADRTRCVGEVVTFGVATQGTGPLTYSWYRNNVLLTNGPGPGGSTIAGATSSAIVISGLSMANAGSYRAVVTNGCGTDNSPAATLTMHTCCPADFNGDDFVNSQDFFDFLNAFFAQQPTADFNDDGFTNSQDFFDFLTVFFVGC
ncbi:MAG: serine hydrolase [Pyrinomonadaceae bacterium]|nr:serine hydrolase [Phycisphaerales bacterium]